MEISSKRVEDQVTRQSDLARVGSRVSQVVRVVGPDYPSRFDDCCAGKLSLEQVAETWLDVT